MKNQEVVRLFGKRVMAVTLSAVLVAGSLVGCNKASNNEEYNQEVRTNEEILESIIEDHAGVHTQTDSGEMTKEETVYVLSDANGNTNQIIVSDWLKNPKAEGGLEDVSNLLNIENTSGNEIFTEDTNGNLHWAANGNDVHYQGTLENANLPVDVKLTYYLDGVEMKPEDIAGKSGNVKIRFDYTNNEKTTIDVNGKTEEVFIPFAMVSGLILSNDSFTDVKVTNGRIISEGSSNIVVGMAFPGLSDSLDMDDIKNKASDSDVTDGDISDIEVPEYVEITATTSCFEIDQTMTIAVADMMSALDSTSNKISLDKMKDSMGELSDASDELSEGTITLSDGAKELMDGAKTLSEKSVELDDGAGKLDDGAGKLLDGSKELDDGMATLANGTHTLKEGTESLVEGAKQLNEGAYTLKEGTSQLVAGYEGDNGAMAGAYKLMTGAAQLNDAVKGSEAPSLSDEQRAELATKGSQGATYLTPEVAAQYGVPEGTTYGQLFTNQIAQGVTSTFTDEYINEIGNQAASTAQSTVLESGDAQQMVAAIAGGLALQKYVETQNPDDLNPTEEMKAVAAGYVKTLAGGVAKQTATGTANQVSSGIASKITEGSGTIDGALGQIGAGLATQVAETIMNNVGVALSAKMAELGNATQQLSEGMVSLYAGMEKLHNGTKQVDDGVGTLYAGTDKLQSGAFDLNNGAGSLREGAMKLKDGTGELRNGVIELKDGTIELKDGTRQFVDGTGELYDGTVKLSDGSIELMDGMLKFDEEGISKLTDIFGDDVDDVVERIKGVVNAGEDYKIFTEVPDGIDSSVKLIYKTEAVGVN